MSDFPPPPPAPPRNPARVSSANTPAPATGWKANLKTKGKAFGKVAYEKSWKWSDAIGGKVNDYAEKAGSERFWPTTGDFQQELDKCERILHTFTVDGVATTVDAADPDNTSTKKKKPVKVLRKIPPEVIQQAVGLAIYTNFRTAIAPFGGSSGTGMVVARLPDGTWSPPSSISPNNYAAGLVYGVDIFDAIVVIRTQKALESFYTHKATLGADIGVVAGPFGAGAVAEVGKERAPVFSYVKSRGLYAGVSILGQIFVERFEENGAMYHWPGVKAKDILTGKVRMPVEAAGLMKQLKDSETGKAQREKGDGLDIVVPEGVDQLDLQEGEVLKLPPTPDMVDPEVGDDDPEASVISRRSSASHTAPRAMPPPLPKRFQSNISSASEYSEPERPETGYTPAAIEHTNAYPISGIDMGGVGINEMDESTRLEHEQYLQALKESEAEHAALQNDKRHSNSTISGPPEYHSDVAPPTNPHVLASDADLQSGMSNLNVNATPVIPQETVYQAQHADDPYNLR